MRCAADRADAGRRVRRHGTRPLARMLGACLLSACLVAACSSASSGQSARNHARPGPFARGRIVVVGGPGGGFLAVPAAAGFNGRPKITVGAIPPADSGQSITLPLNSYADVASLQQTVLAEAQALLTQKCMAERGFVYSSQTTPVTEQDLLQNIEYGYGITSLSNASTYGYGEPPSSGAPPAAGLFLGGFASFSQARQKAAMAEALIGFAPGVRIQPVHEEGCLILANREIYQPGSSQLGDPVPAIAQQASTWTSTDPRVLAVDAAWSRCMAQRGYHYPSPQQAAQHNWPKHPTTAETATAVADVTCKQQTNVAHTWLAVEAAYQAALIAQNITTLASLQTSFQSALSRVETLLASPAGPVISNLGRPRTLLPPPVPKPGD
jgi:hypothetical protein